LSFSLGLSNLSLEILILLDLSLSLLLLEVQLVKECLLLGVLLFLELLESLALESFFALIKSVLGAIRRTSQGDSLIMSLLGSLFKSFLHGGELLQLVRVLWFLDGLNLNDKSVASLDVHGGLDLEFLIHRWLKILSVGTGLILGNCLNLLPRLLSFGCCPHGLLLCIKSGFLVCLVSLLLLGIVDITISLEESSRR